MYSEEATRLAAEEMIRRGYIERTWVNGEEIWTLTDKGRDYLAVLQEHDKEE
jgi:DNA-binding PadR family transcriptional regulator